MLAPDEIIEAEDLPGLEQDNQLEVKQGFSAKSLRQWLREQEKNYLLDRLTASGGNVALAAKMCRIGLRPLSRKIRIHGLDSRNIKRLVSADEADPDKAPEPLTAVKRSRSL